MVILMYSRHEVKDLGRIKKTFNLDLIELEAPEVGSED